MAEILVVEDDPRMRRLIARVLADAGHTVHEASEGRSGLELCRRVQPALVVTDIVMPDMEGIEMIREVRRAAPALPILAVSGSGQPVYLRAATGLGATASLTKPFRRKQLLKLVAKLLAAA